MSRQRGPGRRPGAPDTRSAILEAARTSFADRGFAGTTVRGIASEARVDAALVHHYFGTKDDLFMAALELPVDPRVVLEPAFDGDLDTAAERMLRIFLGVWDDPANRRQLLTMARRVLEPGGEGLLRDGFLPVVMEPLGRRMGIDQVERRMALLASQMLGVIVLRYLLVVEPLASMPADLLVETYAPTLQRYLTGPLP